MSWTILFQKPLRIQIIIARHSQSNHSSDTCSVEKDTAERVTKADAGVWQSRPGAQDLLLPLTICQWRLDWIGDVIASDQYAPDGKEVTQPEIGAATAAKRKLQYA